MRKDILLLILTFVGSMSLGAQSFKGQVFDLKTKQPIPYVNIGIVNKGVGTISDENGVFSLKLEDKYNDDTLRISMIGYKHISLKVQDVKNKYALNAKFYLEETSYELGEVVIRPVKYETAIAGNRNTGCTIQLSFGGAAEGDTAEGGEMGTLIKIKKRSTYIDNISFGICKNDYDSVIIRLNIYDAQTNENVLKGPIYVTVGKHAEVVNIDSRKYDINVHDDFIIAFESIGIPVTKYDKKGKVIGKGFAFRAGIFGSPLLMRGNIYDKWKKIPIAVVGFNATITYEDTGNWFTNLFK